MMLRKNKKAMVKATIIGLALLIISFILMFSFMYQFYLKSTEFINEEACHDALVLVQILAEKMSYKGVSAEYAKQWPGQCKTQDRVYYDTDPAKAEKRLAELESWCWYMMGEGVMKPFDKDWFTTERKCFICYTVSFPNLEGQITPQDFSFYLTDAKAKNGQKYYDYLKYDENPLITTPLADPISKNRIYSIVYTSPADTAFTGGIICLLGYTGIGAGIGVNFAVVGALPGTLVGAGFGLVRCTGAIIKQWTDSTKNDVVYVADINREQGGCMGSFFLNERVETGEGG
jgi:hypothetical protein